MFVQCYTSLYPEGARLYLAHTVCVCVCVRSGFEHVQRERSTDREKIPCFLKKSEKIGSVDLFMDKKSICRNKKKSYSSIIISCTMFH